MDGWSGDEWLGNEWNRWARRWTKRGLKGQIDGIRRWDEWMDGQMSD